MTRRLHPLELRPVRDTRVHAGAFGRMVETIAAFDGLPPDDAATEALRMLDAGEAELKVAGGHAAYQMTARAAA